MIDLEQIVTRRWSMRKDIVKYFTDRGYIFTGYGDEFEVKVKDLPMNATDNVVVVCDHCGNETKTRYNRYNDSIKKYGSYYCSHCNQKHSLEKR